MNVKNCTECSRIFANDTYHDLCPNCLKDDLQKFNFVFSFIDNRKNKHITLNQLSEVSGVSEKRLVKWIKERRLIVNNLENLCYGCEKCSAPIRQDRLCNNCKHEFKQALSLPSKSTVGSYLSREYSL